MDNNEIIDKKDFKQRSASYPYVDIKDSFEFCSKIYENFSTQEFKRDELAHILKFHPNYISRDLSTAKHYGLLQKEGNNFKVSNLFIDIYRPDSEKHKKLCLIKAFGTPDLYIELIKRFDGNTIPAELPNTLIKHFNILENVAQNTAKVFIESGKYVGVISDNNVLKYDVTIGVISKSAEQITESQVIEDASSVTNQNNTQLVQVNSSDFVELGVEDKRVPIHLTKNKIAYLVYPNNVTSQDVELIKHQLEGILLRLKFEKEEEN